MSREQRELFQLKRVNHFWMIPKTYVLLFNLSGFDIICMDFQSFALALIYVAVEEIITLVLHHDPELFITL